MEDVLTRNHQPICSGPLLEQKSWIEATARDAGLSVSRYLRSVGTGYKIDAMPKLVREWRSGI
ncbi:plasmid mobilization protein [Paraburkholderia fungorum]|uniref:plasmid mobilization protein n=1 Tax=Paraburkholderia fungorum TaxID=134537 RepID=UPI0009445DFB